MITGMCQKGGTGPKYITSKVKRKISLLTCTNILQHGNNGVSSWQLDLQQAFVASAALHVPRSATSTVTDLSHLLHCRCVAGTGHMQQSGIGCHGENECNWCLLPISISTGAPWEENVARQLQTLTLQLSPPCTPWCMLLAARLCMARPHSLG